MSYQTGEAQILTLIRASSSGTVWSADNSVSLSNDASNQGEVIFNNGKSWHYLTLKPGPFTDVYLDVGFNNVQAQWKTVITLIVHKETQRGPYKVLAEDRQAIRDYLNTYSRLNNFAGVTLAKITDGGPIITERIGATNSKMRKVIFKQEMTLLWDEISAVTQHD